MRLAGRCIYISHAQQHKLVVCASAAADGNGLLLVKETGIVKYTVILHAGAAPIPSDTTLTLTTRNVLTHVTPDIIPRASPAPACTSGVSPNVLTMLLGSMIPANSLSANISWTCTFELLVTQSHRDAGMIDEFEVEFKYTGTLITPAFHIPAVSTIPVPVYTGGVMTVAAGVVDTGAAYTDKYKTGEQLPLKRGL